MTIERHRVLIQIDALTTLADTLDGRLPRHWAGTIRAHAQYLDRHIDNALANLRTATPDGWGASASGADMGGGARSSGHTTSVEGALTGRLDTTDSGRAIGSVAVLDQLESLIRDAAGLIGKALQDPASAPTRCSTAVDRLKEACNIVDHWHTQELELKSKLTCACGDLPGALQWGDPLCDNIAAEGEAGLCIECNKRREAWRKRREREARRAAHQ